MVNDRWFKDRHSSERMGGTKNPHMVFLTPQPPDFLPHAGKLEVHPAKPTLGRSLFKLYNPPDKGCMKDPPSYYQLNSFPGGKFTGFPISQPSPGFPFESPTPK